MASLWARPVCQTSQTGLSRDSPLNSREPLVRRSVKLPMFDGSSDLLSEIPTSIRQLRESIVSDVLS